MESLDPCSPISTPPASVALPVIRPPLNSMPPPLIAALPPSTPSMYSSPLVTETSPPSLFPTISVPA
ncbi:hypothetical protein G6F68_021341 [Rhizopus microsporus]|nr:hypothetical protein G6F68_021341 [Rhizopus microsporus]